MSRHFARIYIFSVLLATVPAIQAGKKDLQLRVSSAPAATALWNDPGDIRTRNLFYGEGGPQDVPKGPYTFLKEDMNGTNPKFTVRDAGGVKWKVKLGVEAKPETAASRIVWAAGYFVDEDYMVSEMKVDKLPRLKRGQKMVSSGGIVHNVRLKREPKDEKKDGQWSWRDDPFAGSREWNGLRVMMALINNWDLKDENNAIRDIDGRQVYLVSDLGASFGTTNFARTHAESKGDLRSYQRSRFITRTGREYLNFATPSRPFFMRIFAFPEFVRRIRLEWIGHRIPVADGRWIGQILSRLSDDQIQSAFRAAGYGPREVQGFSAMLEERISVLDKL